MEAKTTALATVKQEVRLQEWSAQIEAQQASGLNDQQWCVENGIKPKTYYHLKNVRGKYLDSSSAIVYAAQTATAAQSICPPLPVTARQKMSPCVYAGLGTPLFKAIFEDDVPSVEKFILLCATTV